MKEKISKAIFIIIFWVILFGLLGGISLIKDVFSVGVLWVYVVIKQGIILLLIVIPFYLIFKYFYERKN